MNLFLVLDIVCLVLGIYLSGVAFTWIVCELYDSERRRRSIISGSSIEPMSFIEKLRFSLLWPYYIL